LLLLAGVVRLLLLWGLCCWVCLLGWLRLLLLAAFFALLALLA
jgi:hypothetical protein